ncbi:TRAP transporter small permease [Pusillimonas caeni]|uniref:TRAP transporter small permease n=1 Tax=Pusillimonas caeni TaxID=1348472 RepID=UPI000E59DE95|nr:TRAP transporter small permease [Pusillimonas caeni]TFL15801.1 TRAP transporter small permease [Pusillimonas caeni]
MSRLLSHAAAALCYASVAALVLAMLLICADIISRLALNLPIFGSTDIVELLFAVVLFCALPATFLARRHIVVDIIDLVSPTWLLRLIMFVSSLLSVFLLVLMIWQLADPVSYMYDTGEATLNIELPRWIFGAIALAGLALSAVMEAFRLTAKETKAVDQDKA